MRRHHHLVGLVDVVEEQALLREHGRGSLGPADDREVLAVPVVAMGIVI
jgi:hypothetical protein